MNTLQQTEKETILIVDDNDGDLLLMSMALRAEGYRVLLATSGKEALEVFEKHSKEICLLLTDILMPGMDGVQLVQNVRKLAPQLKVVFTSGYKPNFAAEANEHGAGFVEKGNDSTRLVQKVREVLNSKGMFVNVLNMVFGEQRTSTG